jgi:hypothetical protein
MDYHFDDFVSTLRGQLARQKSAEAVARTLNAMLPDYRDKALAEAKRQLGITTPRPAQEAPK